MSGWVLESSSSVGDFVPHCAAPPPLTPPPPDPQVVPAIKDDEDSVRFDMYLRDEGVDGPVEISNDIALEKRVEDVRFDV